MEAQLKQRIDDLEKQLELEEEEEPEEELSEKQDSMLADSTKEE